MISDSWPAEVRGKMRVLLKRLDRESTEIYATIESYRFNDLILALTAKKGVGRIRAANKIRQMLPGVKWDRPLPTEVNFLLGMFLHHSEGPVILTPRDPGQTQGAIQVRWVTARRTGTGVASIQTGLWTLEVPLHAVARMIERLPQTDPCAVLLDAHQAALAADPRTIVNCPEYLLPAGYGVLVCETIFGRDIKDHRPLAYVRPRTYLHHSQLFDRQVQPTLSPAPPGKERAGDVVLLPIPLRSLLQEVKQ